MRIVPNSLSGRLLMLSALSTILALAFAAVAISHVVERLVVRGLDQQLDAQVAMLARAVRPDGGFDRNRVVNLPAFEHGTPGWGVASGDRTPPLGRGDAFEVRPLPRPLPERPDRRRHEPSGIMPGEGATAIGEPVHLRQALVTTALGTATIVASGPRRLIDAPLREAMIPFFGSLLILGAALALATLVQLRYGLRPLRSLQAAIGDVRAGRRRHVPGDQPDELAPLAGELNALIDQNEAQLDHARRHVANLAHGLKTPLAALAVTLEQSGRDGDGSLRAMVADIDGRVRHHLGRARATMPGAGHRPQAMLAPGGERSHHGDVAHSSGPADRSHRRHRPSAGRGRRSPGFGRDAGQSPRQCMASCPGQVTVRAALVGPIIDVAIEDDGPGLSEAAIGEALVPGRRLDERGDGHGFGLPIVQELAELNGGRLTLGTASIGGLRATLSLPARHSA